jgi:hypothetical protein
MVIQPAHADVPRLGQVFQSVTPAAAGQHAPRRASAGRFCEGRYERAPLRTSAEGVLAGWNLVSALSYAEGLPGSALGDQT